jgi:hypothetical protein
MTIAVAHDEEAGVIGHLPPFVEIERYRVRAFDSGEPRRKYRRKHPERAKGAVDVKPKLFFAAQRAQRHKIIDGADIYRSSRADDEEGIEAGLTIQRNPAAQRGDIDAVESIDLDLSQGIAAETGDIHRLGDAAMRRP